MPVLASRDSCVSGAHHQVAAPCPRSRRSRRRTRRSAEMILPCCLQPWIQASTGTKRKALRLRIAIPTLVHRTVGDGVFARLLAAIDNFTAVPSTFIDGWRPRRGARSLWRHHEERRRAARLPVLPRVPVSRREGSWLGAATFESQTGVPAILVEIDADPNRFSPLVFASLQAGGNHSRRCPI
jgi:hypothetical protein